MRPRKGVTEINYLAYKAAGEKTKQPTNISRLGVNDLIRLLCSSVLSKSSLSSPSIYISSGEDYCIYSVFQVLQHKTLDIINKQKYQLNPKTWKHQYFSVVGRETLVICLCFLLVIVLLYFNYSSTILQVILNFGKLNC